MKFINAFKPIFQDKLAQVLMTVFSIIFGLVKSLSEFVYNKNEINIDIMQSGIYAVICYLLLTFAYLIITHDYKVKPVEIKSPTKLWWIFFGMFLATYIICWLTYWPGTVFVDNWWIAKAGINISQQHPILYILFISLLTKAGIWLGGLHYSIVIYTALQIFIVSLFMAHMFCFIFQRKIPTILKILLFISCLLLPIYAIYAITNVKDIYWSLCMACLTISLYNLLQSPSQSKRFWILFNFYLLGIVLLRNNGIYITLVTLGLLLWILPAKRKQILISLGITLMVLFAFSMWLKALNIQQLFQEKVGVPIQQIAAVIKKDGNINSEQVEFFSKFIPIEKIKNNYDPYSVDSIKWGEPYADRTFLNEHKSDFIKVWKDVVIQNFSMSVLAYLQAIYWYWAPNEEGNLSLILSSITDEGSTLTPWILKNNYIKQEVLPVDIKTYLVKYYETAYHFWHEGSLFWIVAGCALFYYLRRRRLKDLVIYLPVILLWGTLMLAAPIHDFRYVLSYIYVLPFFIALLFTPQDDNVTLPTIKAETKKYVKRVIQVLSVIFVICFCIFRHQTEARIDVTVPYREDTVFTMIQNDKQLPEAEWLHKFGKKGVILERTDNKISFMLVAFQDSDIDIALRGPDKRDAQNKRIEKWVEYADFRLDGEKILSEPVAVWHDQPFRYVLKAEKNHLYKIDLKWRKK